MPLSNNAFDGGALVSDNLGTAVFDDTRSKSSIDRRETFFFQVFNIISYNSNCAYFVSNAFMSSVTTEPNTIISVLATSKSWTILTFDQNLDASIN